MKISFVCSAIFLVCYSSRKLLCYSAFLAIVSFCIVHVCAIVCRVFIALVVPSPNSLTVDWEEVTFLNYPSSLVCHGLHHELLCWFFLPALRHTFFWLHRARTRLYGLGGRHTVWRLSTSCGSRLLSVNDSFPFGCVDLLSLSRPRTITDSDAVMGFNPWIHVCLGVHMSLCIGCRDRLSAGPSPTEYPTGLSLQYVGYLPLVKRISSCIRTRTWAPEFLLRICVY